MPGRGTSPRRDTTIRKREPPRVGGLMCPGHSLPSEVAAGTPDGAVGGFSGGGRSLRAEFDKAFEL